MDELAKSFFGVCSVSCTRSRIFGLQRPTMNNNGGRPYQVAIDLSKTDNAFVLELPGSAMAGDTAAAGRQVREAVGKKRDIATERARLFGQMEAQVVERTAAWQAERKLLSAVVNTSGALVCMVDAAGLIRLFNPACEQVMGWPAAEAIGRPCWEVFCRVGGAQSLARFFDQPQRRAPPSQVHGQWLARDGSPRTIIWSTTLLRKDDNATDETCDAAVELFLGTGLDVTELRGAEEIGRAHV